MTFRPFQDTQFSLNNLQDEMNRMFERVWHTGVATGPFDGQEWAPVVDIEEYPDHYKLYAEVPGVDGGAVELSYIGNELTIRGEKTRPSDAAESDRSVRRERRFGTFCRTVELPHGIEADKLSAKCHNGVLVVTVPKSESSRAKAIKINVTEG
jgi:HSP20 family protein